MFLPPLKLSVGAVGLGEVGVLVRFRVFLARGLDLERIPIAWMQGKCNIYDSLCECVFFNSYIEMH